MRSSIACLRCRRSKVKCVNNGIESTCRSCENSDRECVYPSPVVAGTTRRRESEPGAAVGDGPERRQRPRKSVPSFSAHSTAGDNPRALLDALDPRLLTPAVWEELYDIFQLHYSADLPFIHSPTFLKRVRNTHSGKQHASTPGQDPTPSATPSASSEFLLSFLALTARFHPKLVAHHSTKTSSRYSKALIASEYYASLANQAVNSSWADTPNIQRTQAMLMLGLHEWTMARGAKAWILVGTAIRCAQAMGLQYQMDLDDEPQSRSLALQSEAERTTLDSSGHCRSQALNDSDTDMDPFVRQEIRRRTFWSCFIMDRYTCSGKYRPHMLHASELRIQLPASEKSFMFAEKVQTLMLGEENQRVTGRAEMQSYRQSSTMTGSKGTPETTAHSPASHRGNSRDEDKGILEVGSEEGLVSRFIKVLEIYGKVIKWSCAGGRRNETYPPWDQRCEWYKLHRECNIFKDSLPRQQTLTPQNIQAHLALKTSTPYTLVHITYLLCQIMLHRDYLPFIPLLCSKPEGPLDAPTFPPDKYDVPRNFWDESARDCFKAARDIVDLIGTCQASKMVVETPIVGFAMYIASFVGTYCINFPWMDPHGFMCSPPSKSPIQGEASKPGESRGFQAANKALEILKYFRPKIHLAHGWTMTIIRMHVYLKQMKSDWRKNVQALDSGSSENDNSPVSTRHLSLREGGVGGGLNEFRLFERSLQEFGILEDLDIDLTDIDKRPLSGAFEGGLDDSSAAPTVKSEEADNRPAPVKSAPPEPTNPDGGPWTAINTGPGASPGDGPSTQSAQFRSYDRPYVPTGPPPHHPQQPPPYLPQINSFRSSFSQEISTPGAQPNMASPMSRSATTITHPSPPFDPVYGSRWPASHPSYPMQPPPPAYANGVQHFSQSPLVQNQPHYPTPTSNLHTPHMQSGPPLNDGQQPIVLMQKEAWLNSVDTRLAGDDFAAFVDGGQLGEWANMSVNRDGVGGSWLSAVWGGTGSTE